MVVVLGVTTREPFRLTVPMPWSMLAEVAFADVQLSVEELPTAMGLGAAVISTIGSWFTVTVTFCVLVPLAFVAVRV